MKEITEMILLIGFGSLMSRYGINRRLSTKNNEIFNPFIVQFEGSRGFNTIKGHYMDIGKEFNPVGVQVSINENLYESRKFFECLAYYIKDENMEKIAQREGYPTILMDKIKTKLKDYNDINKSQKGKINISELLWTFYPEQDKYADYREKIMKYREKLGKKIRLNIKNAHCYVPHPVKVICKQINKKVFGLISIHTNIGAKMNQGNNIRLMTINKAIHTKNPPRNTYFLECILGGVHGINVRDLLSGMDINNGEMLPYIFDLKEKIKEEWNNTQNWSFHGDDLLKNLERSGILEYFPNLNRRF